MTEATETGEAAERGPRRAELLAGATAGAFEHGLAGLSLRPLAKALGTSDRMLVYYFGWARRSFKGPRAMGGEEQLTEIEREFEEAARGLEAPA